MATTAAAKKTAAKKAAPPRRSPRPKLEPAVEDMPMPEITVLDLHSEDAEELEPDLVEIFRLDGKPFYIDRNIGTGVTLRFLKAIKKDGENAAVATMLTELLGDEAYDALANFPGVTAKHFGQILLSCQKALLGDEATGPKV